MSPRHKPSRLDASQVLQGAFDEESQRLRVDAEATVVNADIDISLDSLDDSVSIGDEDGNMLRINPDGSLPFSIPSGMASESKQDVANVYLNNISQNTNNIIANPFSSPKDADTIFVDKSVSNVDVIYFKKNGKNGTILKAIRITYISTTKQEIESVEVL
jgi:hypothetical protein